MCTITRNPTPNMPASNRAIQLCETNPFSRVDSPDLPSCEPIRNPIDPAAKPNALTAPLQTPLLHTHPALTRRTPERHLVSIDTYANHRISSLSRIMSPIPIDTYANRRRPVAPSPACSGIALSQLARRPKHTLSYNVVPPCDTEHSLAGTPRATRIHPVTHQL
jgi:hypothetical protein